MEKLKKIKNLRFQKRKKQRNTMRQREYRVDGWMDRANTARVPGYFGRSPDCCCVYIQIPNQWGFLKYKLYIP